MDETFAEYSFRLAREARLRKEAIAAELIKKKSRSKEVRRRDRERRRQLPPHVLELIAADKDQALKIIETQKAKAMKVAFRIEDNLCVSCGDDRDLVVSKRHCRQCWDELKNGIIKPPGISDRQLHSSMCRVVRKGSEMS